MVHCNVTSNHDASLTYLPFLGVSSLMNLAALPSRDARPFFWVLERRPVHQRESREKVDEITVQRGITRPGR